MHPSAFSSFRHENTTQNSEPLREVRTTTKQYIHEHKTPKLLPRRLSEFEKEIEDAINEPLNLSFNDLKEIIEDVDDSSASKIEDQLNVIPPPVIKEVLDETKQVDSSRFVVPCTPLKNFTTPYKTHNIQGSAFKNTFDNKENRIQASIPLINSTNKSKTVKNCIFSTPKLSCKTNTNKENTPLPLKEVSLSNYKTLSVKGVTYEIWKELGKGGSSVVYDCYERTNKINRAIKQVSLENRISASSFINEVRMLEKLQKCPNIIKMYDYEILETKQQLLVVLEKGTTNLSNIIKQNKKLHFYKIMSFWMEMLYAVKQIHQNGIVHCDLKPSNFVMDQEGSLKLIDFGISCAIQNDMTSAIKNVCEGSLNYIGPEALNGNTSCNPDSPSFEKPQYKVNYKLDVWSLGCILYELVYKRTPFQHISHTFAKISVIRDPNHKIDYPDVQGIDTKLIQTMKKCLVYDPKCRSSIDELIQECEDN